jgi:hypothetical protein
MATVRENQRRLNEATRKYVRREISEGQYDAERRRYEVDYLSALRCLTCAPPKESEEKKR